MAKVLAAEGFRVPKQTLWATILKYKTHGSISLLPGSGRPFKLTREMLDAKEEQMKQHDETMATQLVKMLGECGFKISVERASGWTFHGSRYCQLIQNANIEKRVQWAKDNLHSFVDDVVWTDESTIQLENNRTFSYRKALHQSRNLGQGTLSKSWCGLEYQRREPRILPPGLLH